MSTPEFVSIDEAQSLFINDGKKNSSICATVTKIGDLKSGTSAKGDWTKKNITLKDDSGAQILTAWNDDIKKFELNITYKIESPYWTIYDGKPQLSLGKYATVTVAAEPISESVSSAEPTTDEYLKEKQTQIEQETRNFDDKMQKLIVSAYTNDELTTIYKGIEKLIALEHLIKGKFEEQGIELNAQKIGMYMKLIRGIDNE